MKYLIKKIINHSISLIIILFAFHFLGCSKEVSWDRWDEDKGTTELDGVEFVFQIFPESYGMTSGGAPHRLRMRAIGKKELHKEIIVHSIFIDTTDSRILEIKDSREKKYSFGEVQGIRFDEDEHAVDVGFTDSIPFEYNPEIKLKLKADITIITANDSIRAVIETKFHPTRLREKTNIWKIITSVLHIEITEPVGEDGLANPLRSFASHLPLSLQAYEEARYNCRLKVHTMFCD